MSAKYIIIEYEYKYEYETYLRSDDTNSSRPAIALSQQQNCINMRIISFVPLIVLLSFGSRSVARLNWCTHLFEV